MFRSSEITKWLSSMFQFKLQQKMLHYTTLKIHSSIFFVPNSETLQQLITIIPLATTKKITLA
jgi:hypothetical protein